MLSYSAFKQPWISILFIFFSFSSANPLKRARDRLFPVRGQKAEDFVVTNLPGLFDHVPQDEIPLMYSGQLSLEEERNSHYFFWKFVDPYKVPEAENKTIFWFNGGPGCLSLDGALMETGAFRVNKNAEVEYNSGSWHKLADVVYVDQPAGTGFSYGKALDSNMEEVVHHFLVFLDRYYDVFPEERANEVTLAGESYAGQYIPYFGEALLKRNEAVEEGEEVGYIVKLRGLMIGNGAVSGDEQSLSFVPLIMKNGLMSTDHPHWGDLLKTHEQCQKNINKAKAEGKILQGDHACNAILTDFLKYTRDMLGSEDSVCINIYDFKLRDSFPSCGMNWPPILPYVYNFLLKEETRKDLNVFHDQSWSECNSLVHSFIEGGHSEPSIALLPYILERAEVLLFWGTDDIICNYLGGELMVQNLNWGGRMGYSENATEYDWYHDSELAGTYKSERNLTFMKVYNASHMVAFDKSEASRGLVNIFMNRFAIDHSDEKPIVVTKGLLGISDSNGEYSYNPSHDETSDNRKEKSSSTSKIFRIIQLVVIVVLIWGLCALYSKYKSRPVSIIRTETSSSTSKKKNVRWAEDLANDIEETPPPKDDGFLAKAYNLIRKPDSKALYAPIDEQDIEMREGSIVDNTFIITSDDESPNPV